MENIYNSSRLDSKKRNNRFHVNSLLAVFFGFLLFTMFSSMYAYGETITVDVDGESYDVEYSSVGVTLTGIEADLDFISLILDVNVSGADSVLNITFDRSFFDSHFEGSDDAFIVLADGDEPNFTEIETTEQIRTLSIDVPSGTEEIEIIGSAFATSPPPVIVVEPQEPVDEPQEPVDEPQEPVDEPQEPVDEPQEPVDEPPKTQCGPGTTLKDGVCVLETTTTPPKTQCGPGTTLKDGVCVLDEKCGPGTTLKDGVCVLETTTPSTPKATDTSIKGLGKELGVGVVVAFVAAGIIGLILALMSKASKSKD